MTLLFQAFLNWMATRTFGYAWVAALSRDVIFSEGKADDEVGGLPGNRNDNAHEELPSPTLSLIWDFTMCVYSKNFVIEQETGLRKSSLAEMRNRSLLRMPPNSTAPLLNDHTPVDSPNPERKQTGFQCNHTTHPNISHGFLFTIREVRR